jgi:hypothetical protein
MYLESSSASNNKYYKKFGFEVKKDIFVGADEAGKPSSSSSPSSPSPSSLSSQPVRLTIMVREPRKLLPHSIPIKLSGGFKVM